VSSAFCQNACLIALREDLKTRGRQNESRAIGLRLSLGSSSCLLATGERRAEAEAPLAVDVARMAGEGEGVGVRDSLRNFKSLRTCFDKHSVDIFQHSKHKYYV
jgi:hypothetical protein